MKYASLSLVIVCSFAFYSQAQNTYIWKPQGASTSAKVISNWKIATCNGSTATVFPGSSDTLLFSNCSGTNATIDTPMNVRFVNVKSNYTGTITLSGSNTFTADKMRVTGGTFNGGSGTLNISSSLSIDGGTFTSTSATFTLAGNFSKSSGTFNHNNGTVVFKKAASGQPTISGSSITSAVDFYDVIFDAPDATTSFSISSIYFTVNHSMTITGDEQLFINGDTILMAGSSNLTLSNTSGTGGGTADIKFNSSSTQTITGNSGTDYTKLPNVIIAKSGTLNLSGNIGMGGTTYLDYRSGTINEGTSSLLFYHDNTIKGKMEFYDVEFQGHSSSHYLTDTIVINNNLVMTGTATNTVNNGAINLNQNLTYTNSHSSSILNSTIQFTNFSQDQLITGSSLARAYDIKIESGHTLVLQNPMIISHSLTLTSGFIKSTATNLLTLTSGCTVSGGSSSSFLKGPVKKVGNSSFTFPLGAGNSYKPLTISAPSSSTDAFTAEFFGVIQPLGLARSSLTYTSMCEYWNLARTTGSSNVTVRLSWDSHSCDIYTLGTLKIGRWNGSAWADVGSVTTSGNTTAGTITTSSSQSSFGDFLIAKNSPAVTANAGSDAGISLGQSTNLGGSPSASSGTSPYAYEWIVDYALSSNTTANPSASPFSTQKYYLKVTDADMMVDIDDVEVTVSGFELESLNRFPLLADGSITVSSPVAVTGSVGSNDEVDDDITASDQIFISTSEVSDALIQLDAVMDVIDGLSASTIAGTLGGNTYGGGVYRITGNAGLSGTLTLDGDNGSYFVFDIGGSLTFANGASIVLDGVTKEQVFFRVSNDITIPSGSATLNGYFFGSQDFSGTVSGGDISVQVLGEINGNFPLLKNLLTATLTQSPRTIDHFIGYNGTVTTKAEYGWSTPGGFATHMPALSPGLLRYPGGTVSNWWNWQTGWWRGYDNPLFNNALGYDVKDSYPLPEYATDGLPWDNMASVPLPDKLEDFKTVLDACAAFPILNLNLLTSDMGTQISLLYAAKCLDIPVKYIELGNEFYLNGDESAIAFPQPADYGAVAETWATAIKEIFPDVKIAAVAATSKTNILNPPDRRSYWNTNGTFNGVEGLFSGGDMLNVDALTFHVYPWIGLKENEIKYNDPDLNNYLPAVYSGPSGMFSNILSEPFRLEENLENFETGETQAEFSAFADYGSSAEEIWVTEYNQEEDHYNFTGRWLHSLYTAGLTLAFLSNPDVTHVTCQTMFSGADQGAYFSSTEGYPNDYPSSETSITTLWGMAATGYGLKYLGEAMKHTSFADQIMFSNVDKINDITDSPHDGVVGWMFSDGENFEFSDSLIAVIINFTESSKLINVSSLFPLGGTYTRMSPPLFNGPLTFITGTGTEVVEDTDPMAFTYGTNLDILPYSITLIKGTWDNMPLAVITHVNVDVSNSSICSGSSTYEATIYVSGAEKYYISPPVNGQSVFDGPTIVVSPSTTTTYQIAGWVDNPAFVSAYLDEVTITVNPLPSFTANEAPCDLTPCPCPGDARLIELESATEDLQYNWMPQNEGDVLNQINATTSNLLLHPQITTTYTITTTDGICFCSQQVITVQVSEPVDAGPDVYICSDFENGSAVYIGYEPADNLGFHSFEWTYSSGGLSDDEISYSNFSTLPSATTTYTLTDEGFCESEDEVTVHVNNCCNSALGLTFDPYVVSPAGDYWTAKKLFDYLNTDNVYDDSYYTPAVSNNIYKIKHFNSTTDEIVINGLFIVDVNFEILQSTHIIFGPEAKIVIEPNYYLLIDNGSVLSGCDEMWTGIEIQGNLRADDGLIIKDSEIRDAIRSVFATEDSRFNIDNSVFSDNYEAIVVENYGFSLADKIIDNTFTVDVGTIKYPHEEERGLNAIYLNDVPSTQSANGNALITGGSITNYKIGVNAIETGLVTTDIEISNVDIGIKTLSAQGNQRINEHTISDCNIGIEVMETNGNNVDVQLNNISTNALNSSYPTGIYISDFDALGGGTGSIVVGGLDEGTDPDTDLGNVIYCGAMGIVIEGTADASIDHNKIILYSESTQGIGILAENAYNLFIGTNLINDTDFPTTDYYDCGTGGTNCDIDNKVGIFLTMSPNNLLKCNRTNATEIAIQLVDDCTNTDPSVNASIQTTSMAWHHDGIFLGIDPAYAGSAISNQNGVGALGAKGPGNFWKGDYSATGTIVNETFNAGSTLSPQFHLEDANYYNPVNNGNYSVTYPAINIIAEFDNSANCPISVEDFSINGYDDDMWELVVDGAFYTGENEDQLNFNLKSTLYAALSEYETLRSNEILDNFYDTVQENPIAIFYTVDKLIAALNDTTLSDSQRESFRLEAITENNSISSTDIFVENRVSVNDIFLSTVALHNYSFTSPQISELEEIADQCPYVGGEAVFKARGLLRIATDQWYWDDREICELTLKAATTNIESQDQFDLHPNPTSSIVKLKYSLMNEGNYLIILTDILGNKLQQIPVKNNVGEIEIDLSLYASGMYGLFLQTKDNLKYIGKVNLIE